jgi:hypothetical protein
MTTEMSPTAELLQKAGRRPPSRTAIIAMALAGAVAFGGIGFAAGRVTAPSPAFRGLRGGNGFPGGGVGDGQGGGPGQGGGGFRFGGGGLGIQGTVQSISGDTITLKTANGSTLTVNLSSSTTYGKQVAAQQGDIATGSTVRVGVTFQGGQNPGSGTVNASSVTLITP